MDNLEFTGERLIPNDPALNDLYIKHVSRYAFASRYVQDGVVLDSGCGCGYGSYMMALSGARYVAGIDSSFPAIQFCRRYYSQRNVTFFPGDCLVLPFRDNAFDQVVSFEVVEHVPDYGQYLDECHRVLKPGGLFIVSTPNKKISDKMENPFHIKEFYLEEFEFILKQRFEVIDILGQEISPAYVVQSENQQAIYTFLATMINYYEELFTYTEKQLSVLRDTAQQQVEANKKEREFLFKQMPFFVFKAFFPHRLRFFFPDSITRWIKGRVQAKIDFYWNRIKKDTEAQIQEMLLSRQRAEGSGQSLTPLALREKITFPRNPNRKKLSRPPISPLPLQLSDIMIRKEYRESAPYFIALCKKRER